VLIRIRSYNNALGQCRNSISLPNKASFYELSNGSKNIEVKKNRLYILILLVLKGSRLSSP